MRGCGDAGMRGCGDAGMRGESQLSARPVPRQCRRRRRCWTGSVWAESGQTTRGQQQRIAIVRALAMRPRLMLHGAATSALDPRLASTVLDVIKELAEGGMTMLIATHETGFARHD